MLDAFFHIMQTMEKYEPGSWPFSVLQTLNVKGNANKISFNHIPDSKMLFNPEIIICFYEKNYLNLQGIRCYIHKEQESWHPSLLLN